MLSSAQLWLVGWKEIKFSWPKLDAFLQQVMQHSPLRNTACRYVLDSCGSLHQHPCMSPDFFTVSVLLDKNAFSITVGVCFTVKCSTEEALQKGSVDLAEELFKFHYQSFVPDTLATSSMLSSYGFSLQLNSASSLHLCSAVDRVLRNC